VHACLPDAVALLASPQFLLAHLGAAASHLLPTPACPALPACPLLQTADQRKELNELREMKEDVERREKAQAEVISQQVGGVCACGGQRVAMHAGMLHAHLRLALHLPPPV
jgi:hypothetical protein